MKDFNIIFITGLTMQMAAAFAPHTVNTVSSSQTRLFGTPNDNKPENSFLDNAAKGAAAFSLSLAILIGSSTSAIADTAATTTQQYDGFAEYAKENQMEKSDVGCFMNKCGDQTKNLFSNPRGIKGITCLGRCKGEQACAVRCFSEYGSDDLNDWLNCSIEVNECVKVPKNIDNSAENKGYTSVVKSFDPKSMIGTWYKTDGLNPNYDLFDCQTNTFASAADDASELDMGIYFRVARPAAAGGGYWENNLKEHMVIDAVTKGDNPSGRTMHTEGQMNVSRLTIESLALYSMTLSAYIGGISVC
jgi:hypothetical protein